jgi:hypothetical protein
VTANSSTHLAGVPTATILVRVDIADDPMPWAGVAVHEAFHVFQQRRHPAWRPNEVDVFTYPRDDADVLITRWLEIGALGEALAAVDDRSMACHAARALAYRRERFVLIDSASAAYERESERLEGLADYVELRATGGRLVMPEAGFPPEDVRARSYLTGAVIALLLDRADPGWQERIEAGDTRYLDVILASAVADEDCQ